MNKSPLKNYLKFGIYLCGIFIVIFSCQKETIEDFKETAQERRVKRISLSTLKARHNKSNDFVKLSAMFDVNKSKDTELQERLEASDNPYLLTDEIVMIEKEGATFYTFRVETQTESDNFYNYVVVFDDIGNILSTRILEYIPNEIWFADTSQPFVGEVKSQENEFFSVEEINNLFSSRGSGQCITGVSYIWNCGANNDHPPNHTGCDPENNAVTEITGISIQYGACPPELTQGDDGGYPVDTNPGGGGGGGSGSGTSNNNDNNDCVPAIDNPCEEDETAILIPKDNDEEDDDCNTSKEDLKDVFPNTSDERLQEIADAINEHGQDFGIDTKEKLQHFLAQAGHESSFPPANQAAFESFEENLNYRVNKLGILYFTSKFNPYTSYTDPPTTEIEPTKENPNDYASATSTLYVNHELFANFVYDDANRSANYKLGNTFQGDGYKYRGRGIFQLTGRANYTKFNTFYQDNIDENVDIVLNPDLVASDMEIAIISALWYYKKRVLDKITLDSNTTVLKVTELVNGGDNGLNDRKQIFEDCSVHIDCVEE